ncbi:alcohol dehydrogenase (AreB protein) [Phlyctema vagabunda]|uniref:Alcohol dehydrogenase (AreB protein) n=1 Tax=Phlyctema vagabunda TaxID=108571 RepID=A0ABR4PA18_9HELO
MEYTSTNIETVALVVDQPGADFKLTPVVFDEVCEDEYLIEMKYSGICRTDLLLQKGLFGGACSYPAIFGHEGAGIVKKLDPIDKKAAARTLDGRSVGAHFFGQSSFAKLSVVHDQCVVKYPYDDVENIGLYAGAGCGFQTGAGAILNLLKPKPHQSLVIAGLGAVGLTALMAAKILGLKTIIVVDIVESKLDLAKELGATHAVNSQNTDVLAEVQKQTGRGAAFAIDCTGDPRMIELMIECIHPFGTAGSIGDAPAGAKIQIDALKFMVEGKKFLGLVEGDSVPQEFIPKLVSLHKSGEFPLEKLVSIYSIKDLDQALEDMSNGKNVKTVIKWDI